MDDDSDTYSSIKQGLEYQHPTEFDVFCVDCEKKCFELLDKSCNPDLIILDIMLPGINGWEVYDRFKANERWKNIPIIFLSERSDKVARTAGSVLGEAYIKKPFEIIDLKRRIDKVFEQS